MSHLYAVHESASICVPEEGAIDTVAPHQAIFRNKQAHHFHAWISVPTAILNVLSNV
ncbi:hypothetical protein N9C31_01200 [Gammaproteobacteria bacterium]|nr:hypothetical protein [Gammaproteobacteria bacterium]